MAKRRKKRRKTKRKTRGKKRKTKKRKTRGKKKRKTTRRKTRGRKTAKRRKTRKKSRKTKARRGTKRRKTKARRGTKRRKKARKGKKRKPNKAFMAPMQPSPALAVVVGKKALPRTQVVKKIWKYIKKNKLQDPKNRRNIRADKNLVKVFKGKKVVTMFQMTKLLNKQLKKAA